MSTTIDAYPIHDLLVGTDTPLSFVQTQNGHGSFPILALYQKRTVGSDADDGLSVQFFLDSNALDKKNYANFGAFIVTTSAGSGYGYGGIFLEYLTELGVKPGHTFYARVDPSEQYFEYVISFPKIDIYNENSRGKIIAPRATEDGVAIVDCELDSLRIADKNLDDGPDPSVLFEVVSNSQGVVLGAMTTSERDAAGLLRPWKDGVIIFNKTIHKYQVNENGTWKTFVTS